MQPATYYTKTALSALLQQRKRLLIFFILLMAFLLRLHRIDQPYTDLAGWRQTSVAMMADNFYHRNPNILYPEVSWNGPGISYNGREFQTVTYISSLLYRVVGQHDWVGRLVATLFGVWGVFALYQLVRRIWDEAHGLVSAAVLAILPAAVFFDRCFLPDPAMVSLVTTSMWMLVAYLQTSQRRYLFLTAFFACWGFLSKITGMITLLPMLYALIVILGSRNKLTVSNITAILLPGLLAVSIVAAYYLWARYLSLHYPPYHFAGAENWLWDEGLKKWLQQGYFLDDFGYILKNWMWGTPFILLFAAGLFLSLFIIQERSKAGELSAYNAPYLFHFWFVGCLVFYVIGAKEQVGNFWNFHIWSPMVAAFSAATLLAGWQVIRKHKIVTVVAGLLLLAWIAKSNRRVMWHAFADTYYISDYRMGIRLRTLRQPADLSVVLAREVGSPVPVFYSGGRGWVFPPAGKGSWDKLPPTAAECINTLEELRKQGAAWFGIYRAQYDVLKKDYPSFAQYLTTNYPVRADEADYIIFQLRPAKQ
jgi:hypothetical protein